MLSPVPRVVLKKNLGPGGIGAGLRVEGLGWFGVCRAYR